MEANTDMSAGRTCKECVHHFYGTYGGVDFECAFDACGKNHDCWRAREGHAWMRDSNAPGCPDFTPRKKN